MSPTNIALHVKDLNHQFITHLTLIIVFLFIKNAISQNSLEIIFLTFSSPLPGENCLVLNLARAGEMNLTTFWVWMAKTVMTRKFTGNFASYQQHLGRQYAPGFQKGTRLQRNICTPPTFVKKRFLGGRRGRWKVPPTRIQKGIT